MEDLLSFLDIYFKTKKPFLQTNSKPLMVILTIPHAKCRYPNIKAPENCDKIAKEIGELLFKKLNNIVKVEKFVADEYREICDYNRYYCTKNSKKETRKYDSNPYDNIPGFRKQITNTINKYQGDYRIFLLDVHSYHELKFLKVKRRKEVSILDVYFLKNDYSSQLANNCNDFLKKEGIKTRVELGNIGYPLDFEGNDIIDEMNQRGIENFLIEFNEKLSQKRKLKVVNGVVKWIKKCFKVQDIISPVSGVVDKIESNRIGVYIRGPYDEVQDDHNIYAPRNGKLKFDTYQGRIVDDNFKSLENKRGKLIVYVDSFKIEIFVGKGYVTDNIKLTTNKCVKQGQWIGEIIVNKYNSYAYVYISNSDLKKGMILYGGKTLLK